MGLFGKGSKLASLASLVACIGIATPTHADLIANFHTNLSSSNALSIFVFGAENSSGTVTNNGGFNQNFLIDNTGVFEISLSTSQVMSTNGAINNLSFLISSSDPISGIAMNRRSATSDTTGLLDTDSLGKEYYAMSFPGTAGNGGQLSITATEDNTTLTITSPITLAGNPANVPFSTVLQAGESVFYHSGVGVDLTGTKITSDKDVAVFSGAECTNVPSLVNYCDHLVSQQYSVDNFGTDFDIAVNFGGGSDGDLIRILAAEDNTEVFLDGVSQGTINAGQFVEIDNISNANVTSTKPVTVGQYVRGQNGTRTTGDPAFSIIPSKDQYLDSYVFSTPVGSNAFVQNYLNVAISQTDASSLFLNGNLVDTSGFQLTGDTLFGNVSVSQGVGTIEAANPFLAMSAGFSNFDSYFNTIATSFSSGASPNVPTANAPSMGAILLFGIVGMFFTRRRLN